MARQLQHLFEDPRPCSYLDDRLASLEHRILLDVTLEETEALLERGWRRFGPDYFRPGCSGCSACVPTRIAVTDFAPSKSQRRAARKCAQLKHVVGPPIVDDARLALYDRWHRSREAARNWDPAPLGAREYAYQFAMPHPAAREIAYYDGEPGDPDALVGLGICDETQRSWSAVYFFYDPRWEANSVGVANILRQVEVARERGRAHVYLGYRVDGCASMRYKVRFQPQERLVGWPEFDETPVWVPASPGLETSNADGNPVAHPLGER